MDVFFKLRATDNSTRIFSPIYPTSEDADALKPKFKDEMNDEEDVEDQDYDGMRSVQSVYGDDIIKYLVFRDEVNCRFYVTDDLPLVYQELTDPSNPKSFHEVLLPGSPQKLRFDIDLCNPFSQPESLTSRILSCISISSIR